jgi:hypothetical protein
MDIDFLNGEKVLGAGFSAEMRDEGVKTARQPGDKPTRVEGLDLLWLITGNIQSAVLQRACIGLPVNSLVGERKHMI